MKTLCYRAIDLAAILSGMELNCQDEAVWIEKVYNGEQSFIAKEYRGDKRKFVLEISYWQHYFYDKPLLDKEFPVIQKDLECLNSSLQVNEFCSDFSNLDLFFKNTRLRILYGSNQGYVKFKLRTLLKQYGYKRRSHQLLEHMEKCMYFYHLEPSLRGGVTCNLGEIQLDDMVTFRIV